MIRGIFFDLDMCILNTHSLSGPFFQPVIDAVWNSDMPEELKKKVDAQLWTTSLDDTAKLFNISDDITEKMREAYRRVEVPEGIQSFGDEGCIKEMDVVKILVTSGFKRFQETKVDMLGIRSLFNEVIVDASDDPTKRLGKKTIFIDVMKKYDLAKEEVLIVGDNPHSELGVAYELGITSVQTLRPTVVKWELANHHISSLCELKQLVRG